MKQKNWFGVLVHYADREKWKFACCIIASVFSVVSGLIPYYCFYRLLEQYMEGTLAPGSIWFFSGMAGLFFLAKVLLFGLSTGLSHQVAFHVLSGLRRRIADNFLKAPLGVVQKFSIGEIKNILVDKTENIEPPLAHMIPEGAGHLVLPLVSLIALGLLDWRLYILCLIHQNVFNLSDGKLLNHTQRRFQKIVCDPAAKAAENMKGHLMGKTGGQPEQQHLGKKEQPRHSAKEPDGVWGQCPLHILHQQPIKTIIRDKPQHHAEDGGDDGACEFPLLTVRIVKQNAKPILLFHSISSFCS